MTHLARPGSASRLAALLPLLACPACRHALRLASPEQLICTQCQADYPVRDGVPILLPPNMQEPGIGTVSADDPVSRHPYSPAALEIIDAHQGGWVLDLGAGGKLQRWDNVVQVDIFRYPMVDVVATADCLPFRDNAFQAVISQAVFEHLQYPEASAAEIRRVLQPHGTVKIDTAFLQPEHGYPHHFFNATESGLRHWLRHFDIEWSGVEAYQHPQWSLSWFMGVYLDRIGPEHARVLSRAPLGDVLRSLEQLAAGQVDRNNASDQAILRALAALPDHELRTLAAGVSVRARNPAKPGHHAPDPDSRPANLASEAAHARQMLAARQEIEALRERLATTEHALVLATDRGNYATQYYPHAVHHAGWATRTRAELLGWLRRVLPARAWAALRNVVKRRGTATHQPTGSPEPFLSVVTAPTSLEGLVHSFFSLTHQTYPGWELIVIEGPKKWPRVSRAMRDFAGLDSRVRIVRSHASDAAHGVELAHQLARGRYLINLPDGGVLAREAVQTIFTLVRSRPFTRLITTDFERSSGPFIHSPPVRCFNQPIDSTAAPSIRDFAFTVHALHADTTAAETTSGAADALAHIPVVLFHQIANLDKG